MFAQLPPYLPVKELQRIKKWHVAHRAQHPLEYHLWDAVLTLWVLGHVGWLPVFALDDTWAFPLCLVGMLAPSLYVTWRSRAHHAQRLRCDWLVAPVTRDRRP